MQMATSVQTELIEVNLDNIDSTTINSDDIVLFNNYLQ